MHTVPWDAAGVAVHVVPQVVLAALENVVTESAVVTAVVSSTVTQNPSIHLVPTVK